VGATDATASLDIFVIIKILLNSIMNGSLNEDRFSKNLVMIGILPLVEEGLAKINNRGLPIPPILQLLICLRFYSTASFQICKLYIQGVPGIYRPKKRQIL